MRGQTTLTNAWETVNVVIPLLEPHTGENIAEVLQAAVTDRELKRPNPGIVIVTDNACNSLQYLQLSSFDVTSSQL